MKTLVILISSFSLFFYSQLGYAVPSDNKAKQLEKIAENLPSHLTHIAEIAKRLPQDEKQLKKIALNRKKSRDERIAAIGLLYPHMLKDGEVPPRRICVWDPMGRSGPIYQITQDQKAHMLDMGVKITVEAYTNESVLVEELKAEQCDAALMTGLRARTFNKFAGTIDSVGAAPTQKHVKLLHRVLSNSKFAKDMEQDKYTVLGIAPGGAAYIFVNDKKITSLPKAAGKKIAVLDYDPIQTEMILQLGATPVPTNLVSAGGKFNNGSVDVLPAPLVAYNIMELYKGIGDNGGIIDYPFTQFSMQLIGLKSKFPTEVAQLVREEFYNRFDEFVKGVKENEGEIPSNSWIPIPEEDIPNYEKMMQEARLALREKNYYSAKMLTIQRKVRCRLNPAHGECANPIE